MNNQLIHDSRKASQGRGERVSARRAAVGARRIKLGIDVHKKSVTVVRQIDDSTPQPAQRMTHGQFWRFVARQLTLAEEVHSCYEAGPFGYGMHRRLVGLGVSSVVVCPQNWDERNKKAKSDSLDGLALCQRLDRYVAGNRRALAVVSVPTIEQEIGRGRCRERETFKREVNRWAARGRSLLCQFGIDAAGRWWEPRRFEHLSRALHEHEHLSGDQAAMLVMMLQDYREMIEPLEKKLVELTRELRESRRQRADACVVEGVDEAEVADDAAALKCGDVPLPRGLGALTSAKLSREICDWSRFGNRRQVASYTGLCPGVYSSGEARREGPISRHGNPRVRAELIELAWRMWWYQKDYPPVQRWKRRLGEGASRPARKRAIVAIARRLAIDLWRVNTARSTWQKLHCVMQPAA